MPSRNLIEKRKPYRSPKGDHWHIDEGVEVYCGQREALRACPDGSRVNPCWNTAHRTGRCECLAFNQDGTCIHTEGNPNA